MISCWVRRCGLPMDSYRSAPRGYTMLNASRVQHTKSVVDCVDFPEVVLSGGTQLFPGHATYLKALPHRGLRQAGER